MRSKLLDVLRTLTAAESRRLSQFLQSPYFNRRETLFRLWMELQGFAPSYRHPNLKKSKLFVQVMGADVPYDERLFNAMSSDLLKLVYEFLMIEDYQGQTVLREVRLMHALLDRDLPRHLPAVYRKVSGLQERVSTQNHSYHQLQYQLQECLDREFLTHQSRGADPHLQYLNDHLDLAYWINKLRIACGMLSRNKVVNAGYQCHFLEPLLHYIEGNPQLLAANPAMALHFQAYQLLKAEEEQEMVEAYGLLKQALQQHQSILPGDERYAVYNYALNFCIRQINSGESSYYQEILELYQDLLENDMLLKKEQLNQWTYKNIITAGIRSAQFDWTEAFIHNYKSHLPQEEQPHAVAYNLAMLYHARGDFMGALAQLQNIEFGYAFYHVGAKTIQLQIYFEQQAGEAFYALLEAFQKYLHRNRELNDQHKQSNLHFLKLIRRIYDLRQDRHRLPKLTFKSKWEQLCRQHHQTAPVAHKTWLERQIQVMKPA